MMIMMIKRDFEYNEDDKVDDNDNENDNDNMKILSFLLLLIMMKRFSISDNIRTTASFVLVIHINYDITK